MCSLSGPKSAPLPFQINASMECGFYMLSSIPPAPHVWQRKLNSSRARSSSAASAKLSAHAPVFGALSGTTFCPSCFFISPIWCQALKKNEGTFAQWRCSFTFLRNTLRVYFLAAHLIHSNLGPTYSIWYTMTIVYLTVDWAKLSGQWYGSNDGEWKGQKDVCTKCAK